MRSFCSALATLSLASNVMALNLSGAELRELLVGNTIYGNGWDQVLREDGTTECNWGGERDTGVYRISDQGKYCRTWTRWGDGVEACGTIKAGFNEYKFSPDESDKAFWSFKVEEGYTRGYE